MAEDKNDSGYADKYRVKDGETISLKDFPTDESKKPVEKAEGVGFIAAGCSAFIGVTGKIIRQWAVRRADRYPGDGCRG